MKIEIVSKEGEATKVKGDLLEKLATELLKIYNYEVINELNLTGMEIDLLCKFKTNDKEIYVECKAYADEKLIQSDVIKNLVGIRNIKKYNEAWLITTSGIGKSAKGLIEEIKKSDDSKYYNFFTPDNLIEALVNSNVIVSEEVINRLFFNVIKEKNRLEKESLFLVTMYGNFWVKKYLNGGVPSGVILAYAENGNLVKDNILIENLSKLETSFNNLDFNMIFILSEEDGEIIPQNISIDNIKLNPIYLNKINDMGIKLNHPGKDSLCLDDIFVYPDIEEIKDDEKETKIISSKNIISDLGKYFIFGEEISGKTSLSYVLQKNININNLITLYIDASEIKKPDNLWFNNLLIKKFEHQYKDNKYYVNVFKKITENSTKDIVLIIDNYDSLGIKRSDAQINFLNEINNKFVNIIIFANKRLEVEAMAKSEITEILSDFKLFRLKELGHVLRDELVEKWITLGDSDNITDSEFYDRKDSITDKINISVGTNFIPTFPLYILTMLQFIDDNSPFKIQSGSYAELYRSLVTQALAGASAKAEDLDFFHTYLSHIAYFCFKKRKKVLTKKDITSIYESYSKEMDIEKRFERVHDVLIKAKILKEESNIYQFNHNYSYYFFVAKYLAENIEKDSVENDINDITNRLYLNESANIIIFLIHHSKDQFIIDRIMKESIKLFKKTSPYTISYDESNKINSLIEEEIKLSLMDENTKEYRKKRLEDKDKNEKIIKNNSKTQEKNPEIEKKLDLFSNINLSFKLIEIQGQIAKNYYGSLNANKKAEILDESCRLGLRGLRLLLEDFSKFQSYLEKEIKTKIQKNDISLEPEINKIVNNILFAFNGGLINVFVKKISDSISSKNLLPSIRKMEERENTPAIQLINLAVELNFPNGLNKEKILYLDKEFNKNYLAKTLLRVLVMEHIYKFNVKYSEKQRICDILGINLLKSKKLLDITKQKIKRVK